MTRNTTRTAGRLDIVEAVSMDVETLRRLYSTPTGAAEPMTATATLVSGQDAAAPEAPTPRRRSGGRHPSQEWLEERYQNHLARDQDVSFEMLASMFGDNPFIQSSRPWIEYEEFLANRARHELDKYLKLPDAPVIRLPSKRRLSQPTFKPEFETVHDARLRLGSGAIFIGADLYYVVNVFDYENDFLLCVRDKTGTDFKCLYKKVPEIDLRSPEPQYFNEGNAPRFLIRPPHKQQRQAICYDNIYSKGVGSTDIRSVDPKGLMRGLTREFVPWSSFLYGLMAQQKAISSIRLSKDIAFYRDGKDILTAEYRGRLLGEVNEDTITVDDLDISRPWLLRDVNLIGCRMRTK